MPKYVKAIAAILGPEPKPCKKFRHMPSSTRFFAHLPNCAACQAGKRVAAATAPLKKKAYWQTAKARKAMSAAKKVWWAAKKKQTKAA